MFTKTDRLIRYLLLFLLAFAPLAFGSVEAWSRMVLITTANAITLIWIARELLYPDESRRYRREHSHQRTPFAGLLIPGLIIPALIAVQLFTSAIPGNTLIAGAILISFLGLFFALLNTNLPYRDIRFLVKALVTAGFAYAFIGIIHKLSGSTDLLWIRTPRHGGASIFGPYVNQNHFAALMALIIPLGTGFYLSENTRQRDLHQRLPRQTLLVFALIVMTGALFMTLSRGGMLALVATMLLFGLLLAAVFPGRHRKSLMAGAALAALVFAFWLGGSRLSERLATFGHLEEDKSVGLRIDMWELSLGLAKENPILGTGLGTYAPTIETRRSDKLSVSYVYAHNDPLQLLTEFGAAGFLAIAAFFALYLRKLVAMTARRKNPAIQYLAVGGACGLLAFIAHSVGEFNFHVPANAFVFSLTAALAMKTAYARPPVPRSQSPLSSN